MIFSPVPLSTYGYKSRAESYQDETHRYAVDIGLSKFFDNVDHDLLMHRLAKRISDKRLLALIGKYLRAGVSHNGKIKSTLKGVPQGGSLSPLLANIMLDDLDRYLESIFEKQIYDQHTSSFNRPNHFVADCIFYDCSFFNSSTLGNNDCWCSPVFYAKVMYLVLLL